MPSDGKSSHYLWQGVAKNIDYQYICHLDKVWKHILLQMRSNPIHYFCTCPKIVLNFTSTYLHIFLLTNAYFFSIKIENFEFWPIVRKMEFL